MKPLWVRAIAAGCFALSTGAVPPLALAAGADASAQPAVILTGSVTGAPGPASVLVTVELPFGRNTNRQHVATRLVDVPVARQDITGAAFRVEVPYSAALLRAEQVGQGNVNFYIIVFSGHQRTSQYVPVAMSRSAAPGNIAVARQVRSQVT